MSTEFYYNDMEVPVKESPQISDINEEETIVGFGSKVILFNDDVHTFEEVIEQIIKATKCSVNEAQEKTFEVHTKGKAVVFAGEFPECLRVSGVLEEILLHTQIET